MSEFVSRYSKKLDAVGAALREERKRRGLTQEEAGRLVSMSAQRVSEVERGQNITITTALRLADAYDTQLALLFTRAGI